MNKRILKVYILVLSSVLLLFFTNQILIACSGGDEEDAAESSLFSPHIIEQPKWESLFYSYHTFYEQSADYDPPTNDSYNLTEWSAFFNDEIAKEDLAWLIYGAKLEQITALKNSYLLTRTLPDSLMRGSLKNALKSEHLNEVFTYLELAKQAEKYANQSYSWWDYPGLDTTEAQALSKSFLKGFIRNQNTFLKYRFGFQLLRSFYFSGDNAKAENVIKMMPALSAQNGSMYYRIWGYTAAAYYKQKEYAKANLIYATLYDEYEPLLLSSYQSFHPLKGEEWQQNLSMAQTNRQKENLWQLMGVYTNPLQAMNEIYHINPASDLMSLLLVRNINIIEEGFTRYPKSQYAESDNYSYWSYRNEYMFDTVGIAAGTELNYTKPEQLLSLINTIILQHKVPAITPYLLSAAYLNWMTKNYSESKKQCAQVLEQSSNQLLINQAHIINALVYCSELTQIGSFEEQQLAVLFSRIKGTATKTSRDKGAVNYLMYVLGEKYKQLNNTIKSELCHSDSDFLKDEANNQKMIDFLVQPEHTEFEKLLQSRYYLSLSQLYNMKGVNLLYAYNFDAAAQAFKNVKADEQTTLYGDPFLIHIYDCHDCDHGAFQSKKYNKYDFAVKMAQLKKQALESKDNEGKAKAYFTLANGLYNMTYYGNARVLHESALSWQYGSYYEYESKKESIVSNYYYDCTEVQACYLMAKRYTTDKEFAATCTWMCAKCEQNLKLEQMLPWIGKLEGDFEAGTYFKQMKADYGNTQYFKEVIKECGYFCTYITGSTSCVRNKE